MKKRECCPECAEAGRPACFSSAAAVNPVFAPGVPQSAGMQLKNENFARQDIERVRGMGFCGIRKGIYWNVVEPEKGKYVFDEYDRLFDDAGELGLWVVGCLFGGNKDYEDTGEGGIQTEDGRKGFAGFAAAMAERYAGRRVMWEIWNEPNVRTFWRRSGTHNSEPFADEYTALVKEVMRAILAVAPNAYVMAGSVSNYWEPSYQWTEFCFRKGILDTGIRAWSVHPYGVRTPEEFAIGHGRTRALLNQYGAPADFPMLNTERGFSVKQTEEGWSGGSRERALEFQAWHFVRQSLVDLMHDVRLTVWYEWISEEFGLFDGDGTRPIAQAARVMLEQLKGYRYQRRIKASSERDYLLQFANGEGERMLVAWTSPPPGGTPEEAEVREVSVETGVTGAVEVVSLTGARRKPKTENGALRLSISGEPQYIEMPRGA